MHRPPQPQASVATPSAVDPQQLATEMADVMAALFDVVERETDLVRAGRVVDAMALEADKSALSRRYVNLVSALKANQPHLRAVAPDLLATLQRQHETNDEYGDPEQRPKHPTEERNKTDDDCDDPCDNAVRQRLRAVEADAVVILHHGKADQGKNPAEDVGQINPHNIVVGGRGLRVCLRHKDTSSIFSYPYYIISKRQLQSKYGCKKVKQCG